MHVIVRVVMSDAVNDDNARDASDGERRDEHDSCTCK